MTVLLVSAVVAPGVAAAATPGIPQAAQGVRALLGVLKREIADINAIKSISSMPSLVQGAPQLLTGNLSSVASSQVDTLAADMLQVDQTVGDLAKLDGPTALGVVSLMGNVSLGFRSAGVDGWIDGTPGKTSVCLLIPGKAVIGVSEADPLCGGVGPQLANPDHTMTAFVDFTPGAAGAYIDARLPVPAQPGQMPTIDARAYVPLPNGHHVQVDFATGADQKVTVHYSVGMEAAAADIIGGKLAADAKLSLDVSPAELPAVVAQGDGALQAWLAANAGQIAASGTLTPAQAAASLHAVVQAVNGTIAPSDAVTLDVAGTGAITLGVGTSGLEGTINAASASGAIGLKAPISRLVDVATGTMQDILIAEMQMAAQAQQFTDHQLSGDASAASADAKRLGKTWVADSRSLITDLLGSVANVGKATDLEVTLSADELGAAPVMGSGCEGTGASASINLFCTRATIQLGALASVATQPSFWVGLGKSLTGVFSEAMHTFDSGIPAESLAPLSALGRSFKSVLAAVSFELNVNLALGTEATLEFDNVADLASVAQSDAQALARLVGTLVTSADKGSLSPFSGSGVTRLFVGTAAALRPLADSLTIGLLVNRGLTATGEAGVKATIGGGYAVVARTTPELLMFLAGVASDPSAPGQATVALDTLRGASAGVSMVVGLTAGTTRSATLLQLTLTEWDQAVPTYTNVLDVFGFPVVGFTGSGGGGSLPQGTGYLILPDTLGFGGVPVTLGVSNGAPHDTWGASLQVGGHTFHDVQGTLDAQGLHWKGQIGVLGSGVDFDLTLTSAGVLTGTFQGDVRIAGWQLTQADLQLAADGTISGTASLSAGPFAISQATLAVVGGKLEGQGDLTVDNVSIANAQFEIDQSGTIRGWGEVGSQALHLWSQFQGDPSVPQFSLSGGSSTDLSYSGSLKKKFCVGSLCVSGDVGLSASLKGGFGWSGQLGGGSVGLSAHVDNSQVCGSAHAHVKVGLISVGGTVGPDCVPLQGWSGTLDAANGSFGPGCLIHVKIAGVHIDICPTFPIPPHSGQNHLPAALTQSVGYTAAQTAIANGTATAPPAPTVTATVSPAANAAGWVRGPVTVSIKATPSAGTTVAAILYSLDGGPWTSASMTGVSGGGAAANLTVSRSGRHTLFLYATDGEGGAGPVQSLAIRIDTVAPTASAQITGRPGTNGWYRAGSPVQLALQASDPPLADGTPGSGVVATTVEAAKDGATATATRYTGPLTLGQGRWSVRYGSVDAAGNAGAQRTATVDIDTTPPVTSATPNPGPNALGWNDTPVAVALAATDNLSGVARTEYSLDGGAWIRYAGTAVQITTEGRHVLRYRSIDEAGNVEAARQRHVRIDLTPPVTTATPKPAPNAAGWNKTAVSVTLKATDNLSGVRRTEYRLDGGSWVIYTGTAIPITTEGRHVLRYRSIDRAGNVETTHALPVRIDETPPVTTATPNPPPDAYGWNNTPVSVALKATDNLSGVRRTEYRLDGGAWVRYTGTSVAITAAGRHVLQYRSIDRAGNLEATQALHVNIDVTPPEALLQFDPSTQTLAVSGTDALSGVPPGGTSLVSCAAAKSGTGNGAANGAGSVGAQAGAQLCTYLITDRAGNSLSVQLNIHATGHHLQASIVALTYTTAKGSDTLTPPSNSMQFEWTLDGQGALQRLTEQVSAGSQRVQTQWDARSGQTQVNATGQHPVTRSGLVVVVVHTAQGSLSLSE